ncbi:DUF3800 domain-containing protein [Mucilaginibacter flavidus]|uniref:DUF3800 domain-containing protein n=1 Tax=Mucilaginibacter flavidus TaxID=2949309 RepID=UPI002093BBC6|nr:DUF3800 domain-containing protein [Mucilaginibacter flavidus]MCO5949390.1 DUF3800 domain-containing protein [Mucilaginibacter flavidus]
MTYDLFLDESCHLEHDDVSVMTLGYVKVPHLRSNELRMLLRRIKEKHNMKKELKWSKFSKAKIDLYKELVDYFFDTPIEFNCVLVKYKERLDHSDFNMGPHDNYYYRIIFYLLHPIPTEGNYRVFIDFKDTRGKEKLEKIHELLNEKCQGQSPFSHFQHLRSHENEFFQLTDFFIGAIAYKSRLKNEIDLPLNESKQDFISYLELKSGFSLDEGTAPWETKFKISDHQPKIRQ